MPSEDGGRDQVGDGGGFAVGVFDGVQSLQAGLQILFVLLVPVRDAGVEVPAVIVEAWLAGESFDFRARLLLDVREAHDYVGDLYSGVVDVILDVDFRFRVAQETDEGVAEDGVAQVADVGGLVGGDAGVFDENFAGRNLGGWLLVGSEGGGHPGAVEFDVDVAGRGDLHFGDAFDGAGFGADFFGDLQRGGTQRLGERERWNGEVAQFDLGGLLDDRSRERDAGVAAMERLQDALGQPVFEMTVQGTPLSC